MADTASRLTFEPRLLLPSDSLVSGSPRVEGFAAPLGVYAEHDVIRSVRASQDRWFHLDPPTPLPANGAIRLDSYLGLHHGQNGDDA